MKIRVLVQAITDEGALVLAESVIHETFDGGAYPWSSSRLHARTNNGRLYSGICQAMGEELRDVRKNGRRKEKAATR